ncbi:MFS transporter [Streptomyces xanthochromogenes]|uniref:MFS transporter n=1 Tax=Streptomyces xanthochromogenes TaxID=67384 RepID=UPI00167786CD|nr:MFS transporter [Streptomyces xanthochromogenes]GHB71890.1 MFS transporter [Streptomyces xanthochromogenes]
MSTPTPAPADPRRWEALFFICLAQLMVVLDVTVMNIALPSVQSDLGFSDGSRQWVITAYSLTFGGLLLLGGRLADLWGHKRTLLTGIIGFAAASALGGAALNTGMLIGARALQGIFGAMLVPAVLSLMSVMFTDTKERAKAFGVFGALSGGGAAIGLMLGGLLTQALNWRWTLLINIFIGLAAALGALRTLPAPAADRPRPGPRLDVPGVLLASTGVTGFVYGLSHASEDGWTSAATLGPIGAGLLLLAAFAGWQTRAKSPLLPLRVLADRNRGGAYLAVGLAVIGNFGMYLFLTYYLQTVLGLSPVQTGAGFLPIAAASVFASTQIGPRLAPRLPARALMGPGFLIAAGGLLILSQITPHSSYWAIVLPGMLITGLGLGTALMPAFSLGTLGARPEDAGIASAMVNTSQQVGGAIGTALLNTLAATSTTTYLTGHTGKKSEALVHGYSTALWWAAGILTLAALAATLLITHDPRPHPGTTRQDEPGKVPAARH